MAAAAAATEEAVTTAVVRGAAGTDKCELEYRRLQMGVDLLDS